MIGSAENDNEACFPQGVMSQDDPHICFHVRSINASQLRSQGGIFLLLTVPVVYDSFFSMALSKLFSLSIVLLAGIFLSSCGVVSQLQSPKKEEPVSTSAVSEKENKKSSHPLKQDEAKPSVAGSTASVPSSSPPSSSTVNLSSPESISLPPISGLAPAPAGMGGNTDELPVNALPPVDRSGLRTPQLPKSLPMSLDGQLLPKGE